jgi:hypothetical protein
MCSVITPDGGHDHGHTHTSDPLEAAELLRESLAEELRAMNDLVARWHMVEEEISKGALAHAVGLKRQALQELFCALQELEMEIFEEADYQGCSCGCGCEDADEEEVRSHAHTHSH